MYQHTSVLDVEVTLKCHGRRTRLSLRAMAPFLSKKNTDLMNPRGLTCIDLITNSCFEKMNEIAEDWQSMDQRLAGLEPDARQPRLAIVADGQANTETRERTEGAATAVQAMYGDNCPVDQVDPDPMCSPSFGDDCTGSPAPPCSGKNTLVDNGVAAPKSCLPSLEMRSPTAAGGLPRRRSLYSYEDHLKPATSRLYSTEEMNSRIRILYVS